MPRVPHRRKAGDLYVRGVPLALDDGETDWVEETDDDDNIVMIDVTDAQGNVVGQKPKFIEVPMPPVTMWVAKLSNPEMTTAMKFASQAKSVALAGKLDHDSQTWKALRGTLADLDRSAWEGLIIEDAMRGRVEAIEARLQHATVMDENGEEKPGKWAKDNYLEGLFTAWVERYQSAHAQDPKDKDALRILSEIDAFNTEVRTELEYELEVEKQNLRPWSNDVVLDRATELLIEGEGIEAWNDEYVKRIVFLAARDCEGPDPDRPGKCLCRGSRAKHTEPHFDTFEDVEAMDEGVRRGIYDAYCIVQVDPAEGKGSPARPASSTLSELFAAVVDSASSSQSA